jgi:hypothetical protein
MSSIIDPAWLAKHGYKLTPEYQRRQALLTKDLLSRRELLELGVDEEAVQRLTNPDKVKRRAIKDDAHLFLVSRVNVRELLKGTLE